MVQKEERGLPDPESRRLGEDARREKNWKRWGPYLSERQWGTVREDYSADGNVWSYFPHDHARSRAYRWGEDGLMGICDREGRLSFALALWNERDPILKERLFGLSGPEGNHGEDVKECYYYLDSTPTHSYMKALYKYPQGEYPYRLLVEENGGRGRNAPELELVDTGAFDEDRYFDVFAEYAKASPNDLLIRLSIINRGPDDAALHLLPTLWFRNTWSWGRASGSYWPKPRIERAGEGLISASHPSLGEFLLAVGEGPKGERPELLFTDNETNAGRLYGLPPAGSVKDAFHDYVIRRRTQAVNGEGVGTKAAAYYRFSIPSGAERTVKLRLFSKDEAPAEPLSPDFDRVFGARIGEASRFYERALPDGASEEERNVLRQGYAGLLWSKQFYHYVVRDWLEGDPGKPPAPRSRWQGRNHEWTHLYNYDVVSMPDKWEYPWYAAWDLAFHVIPFATVDIEFAKQQLLLFLREWYMHPNGQLPAYEFAFSDVNPPVHAWAALRVYERTGPRGRRDRRFLARVFHKLLLNFTWWVNRKDVDGKNLFAGGFLGLDNIGVFDRSRPLPTGGHLDQADGTAWMAFFCITMLSIALELASEDPVYEDVASKFFEHFMAITDAMNSLGGTGLWDDVDGFYYDQLHVDGTTLPLRVRSIAGLVPLLACGILEEDVLERLPGFSRRMRWFLDNRQDLTLDMCFLEPGTVRGHRHRMLAIPSCERIERTLRYLLDENEFLSPCGVRSLSRAHKDHPYVFELQGERYQVEYDPGESRSGRFGGNSNWRGPVWFPLNYLLIEALERYHHFFGDGLTVECPTGSGRRATLKEVARELDSRLGRIFLPDAEARRPAHGQDARYHTDPNWRNLLLFYEYFHGDTGRGLGASHQTGWTALALPCIERIARERKIPPDDGR